jgi:hypothetical protein
MDIHGVNIDFVYFSFLTFGGILRLRTRRLIGEFGDEVAYM